MSIKKIPCGGFYVDDDAVQIVDGKPVLSAWNAELPKPSVGGYGYTEQGEQVLYDGALLINDPVYGSDAVSCRIDIDRLEVGETYKVIWNGDEYVCNCLLIEDAIPYIGNASILGLPIVTDYPFLVVVEEGEVIVATMSAGTYSIKLSKNGYTIHKIDEKYLPSGGGLPDPTEMPNGTMMVAVNGEWKEQSGYGYEVAAIEPIIIKPEDEPTITAIMSSTDPDEEDVVLYCAKQGSFSKNDFIDGKLIIAIGEEQTEMPIGLGSFEDGDNLQSLEGMFYIIQDFPAAFDNDNYTISGVEPGVYYDKRIFSFGYKSLSLIPPTIVQTIDQKFIPNGGGSNEIIVEFETADFASITANYTPTQVRDMASNGKLIKGALYIADGSASVFYYEFSYTPEGFRKIVIMEGNLMCLNIDWDISDDTWSISTSAYTLTPATA